jgi:biopolymer transport protein ExbB/TolQ
MDPTTTTTLAVTATTLAGAAADLGTLPAPDPTQDLDILALIHQGALSTYPLLVCSVIVLAIALERLWSLRGILGSTARLTAAVVPQLARGDWKGALAAVGAHNQCPARRIYGDVLDDGSTAPVDELEKVAQDRTYEEVQGASSNLWILGTIGSAAPFIGLFGTVLGIIRAFHAIALSGTGGFAVVSSGISEALIATALGLAVGIVAVVLFNYFQAKVDRIEAALRIGSARVIEAVVAGRRAHGVQ